MHRARLKVLLAAVWLCCLDAAADVPLRVLTGGDSGIIYIITPPQTNAMFRQAARAAEKTARMFGYLPKVVSHDDSPVRQAELFEQAIAEKAAAIVCDNAGSDATVPAVKRAYDNNIPTFLIDRGISELGFAVSQIVSDPHKSATALAALLAESMQYAGEYCELYGQTSDLSAYAHSESFREVLGQYPGLECVEVIHANWDQHEAYLQMRETIRNHPKLKGVISSNDAMALGALEALREAGLTGVKIVTVGGTAEVRAAIRQGTILATAVQPIATLAKSAVLQLEHYLKYGTTGYAEVQFFDCVIVTDRNVDAIDRLLGDASQ